MKTPTILVAEDNVDDVFLLRRASLKVGLKASLQFVPDGQEALNYLEGADRYSNRTEFPIPALVLLDIKMPRKNGFEVLEAVRAISEWNRLPIIIFSSSDEPEDVARAMKLGADSYLVKPLTQGGLVEVVKKLQKEWLNGGGGSGMTRINCVMQNFPNLPEWME